MGEHTTEKALVSLILRVAIASLFIGAAVPKWMGPAGATAAAFEGLFKETWLPLILVKLHGRLVPWIEAVIPLWLLLGFRLRAAWTFTALFLVSLAFGMIVAQKGDVAASNFVYVMIACAGLYFSPFDRFGIEAFFGKGSCCSG